MFSKTSSCFEGVRLMSFQRTTAQRRQGDSFDPEMSNPCDEPCSTSRNLKVTVLKSAFDPRHRLESGSLRKTCGKQVCRASIGLGGDLQSVGCQASWWIEPVRSASSTLTGMPSSNTQPLRLLRPGRKDSPSLCTMGRSLTESTYLINFCQHATS